MVRYVRDVSLLVSVRCCHPAVPPPTSRSLRQLRGKPSAEERNSCLVDVLDMAGVERFEWQPWPVIDGSLANVLLYGAEAVLLFRQHLLSYGCPSDAFNGSWSLHGCRSFSFAFPVQSLLLPYAMTYPSSSV
jgi:hypothetical protein